MIEKFKPGANLEKYGFSDWFIDRVDLDLLKDFELARVLTVNRDNYSICIEDGETRAELAGKFLYMSDSPDELPTVGDWIYVQTFDGDSPAIIHELFPRKTVLKRKTPGKRFDIQLLGANIDFAVIMQGIDLDYSPNRLQRFIAMARENGVIPVVLFSKIDLVTKKELKEKLTEVKEFAQGIKIFPFSNITSLNFQDVLEIFVEGKSFCLLGSSGVGKTTLLNNILGDDIFEVQEVKEFDGRGRHTTTKRQMLLTDNGAIIIDTPGMRELGNVGVEAGIEETFDDLFDLASDCKFSDCKHQSEPGCAIVLAMKAGKLAAERYGNFIKLQKESKFNEMSFLEKRRKDKGFGKMIKQVMKDSNKKPDTR